MLCGQHFPSFSVFVADICRHRYWIWHTKHSWRRQEKVKQRSSLQYNALLVRSYIMLETTHDDTGTVGISTCGTGDLYPTAHALAIVTSYPWLFSNHEQDLASPPHLWASVSFPHHQKVRFSGKGPWNIQHFFFQTLYLAFLLGGKPSCQRHLRAGFPPV